MGNIDSEHFCSCDNSDSRFETSFKGNHTNDMLCPFIKTVIYQNYNIDNSKTSKNTSKKKGKETIKKNKAKNNFIDYEMNFEYHTSKINTLKDSNKTRIPNKSFFNLHPSTNTNYDKNSFNNDKILNNKKEENEIKNKIEYDEIRNEK